MAAEVQRKVCLEEVVAYCPHGESLHPVCLVGEELAMTSYFLLLAGQKEVEAEEDLIFHLHFCPAQAVSRREVEEGVRIALAEERADVRLVTGFVQEVVAYVHLEYLGLGDLAAVEELHSPVASSRQEKELEGESVYCLLMEEVEGEGCPASVALSGLQGEQEEGGLHPDQVQEEVEAFRHDQSKEKELMEDDLSHLALVEVQADAQEGLGVEGLVQSRSGECLVVRVAPCSVYRSGRVGGHLEEEEEALLVFRDVVESFVPVVDQKIHCAAQADEGQSQILHQKAADLWYEQQVAEPEA